MVEESQNSDSAHGGVPYRRSLLIIVLARTALNTSYRIVYPFLPTIARGLGISLQAATGLVTLRVAGGLAAPILGPMGDRYGRRPTMAAGLALFAFGSLFLAGMGTLAAAAVAFALSGIAKILYDPSMRAYIGDTVPYEDRGRAVGIVELSWSGAWLIGVPVSGYLMANVSWRSPWIVMGVLGLLGVWLTHSCLPAAQPSGKREEGREQAFGAALVTSWRCLLRRRPVVVLLLASLLLALANEAPLIVYGAWLETEFGLGLGTLGLASMVVGLSEVSAELGAATLIDRIGKKRSVLLGLLALASSLFLLPWLSKLGLAAALAAVVLMVLSFEFAFISLIVVATETAPDARSTLISLNITAQSVGRMVGALAGGWLWQWQSISYHALLGSCGALLAAALVAWGMPEPGKQARTPQSRTD